MCEGTYPPQAHATQLLTLPCIWVRPRSIPKYRVAVSRIRCMPSGHAICLIFRLSVWTAYTQSEVSAKAHTAVSPTGPVSKHIHDFLFRHAYGARLSPSTFDYSRFSVRHSDSSRLALFIQWRLWGSTLAHGMSLAVLALERMFVVQLGSPSAFGMSFLRSLMILEPSGNGLFVLSVQESANLLDVSDHCS